MKRADKAHSRITDALSRLPRLVDAGLLVGMLVAGVGCQPADGHPMGPGAASAAGGATAGSATGPGGSQLGDAGGDPYAVPASPPASVLVPTPRVARLSRQQWANAVRDLLKLSDISAIESNVSGDALIGFDSEAEGLFVTEQLRAQLFDAS